jgi:hypothetical protein
MGGMPKGPTKPKQRYATSTKLKQLQWNALPASNIKDTFWSTLEDRDLISTDEVKELESAFAVQDKKSSLFPHHEISPLVQRSESQNQLKDVKDKKIAVLDPKKAYNLCTFSSRVN